MATLDDPRVKALLDKPNHAVVSTLRAHGCIHSTVVWVDVEDGRHAVNSAVGRARPTNGAQPEHHRRRLRRGQPLRLRRGPQPGGATPGGAKEHVDRLAKKYMDLDEYPFLQPGEQRITFLVAADRIRHQKPR